MRIFGHLILKPLVALGANRSKSVIILLYCAVFIFLWCSLKCHILGRIFGHLILLKPSGGLGC